MTEASGRRGETVGAIWVEAIGFKVFGELIARSKT